MASPAVPGGGGLPDANGPGVWESAAHARERIPEDAHEYNARRAARDATFQSLQYLPFCSHMPTCKGECATPRWAWRPKPR